MAESLGRISLTWEPPEWPARAGEVIRYSFIGDEAGAQEKVSALRWNAMKPLHMGFITDPPFYFDLPGEGPGIYAFAGRTIDVFGQLGLPAWVFVGLSDAPDLRKAVIPPIKETADEAAAEAVTVGRRVTTLETRPRQWALLWSGNRDIRNSITSWALPAAISSFDSLSFEMSNPAGLLFTSADIAVSSLATGASPSGGSNGRRVQIRTGSASASEQGVSLSYVGSTLYGRRPFQNCQVRKIWGIKA